MICNMKALYINPAHVVELSYYFEEHRDKWVIAIKMTDGQMHWIDWINEDVMHKFINSLNFIRVI